MRMLTPSEAREITLALTHWNNPVFALSATQINEQEAEMRKAQRRERATDAHFEGAYSYVSEYDDVVYGR